MQRHGPQSLLFLAWVWGMTRMMPETHEASMHKAINHWKETA